MNVGVVGTSFISEWLIDAMQKNDVVVSAIFSRNVDSGKQLADKFNVEKVYTDFNELLNDSTIDFVYLASPNSLHFKQAKEVLLANKNVIVEKPFFSNLKEGKEISDLARSRQLFVFEAITTVHNPNFKLLKEKIDELKPIRIVQANMSQYSRKYDQFLAGEHPNVFTTKFSGGALMDINIYNLHFIMGLFGKPNKVQYIANTTEGIDHSGTIILEYDGFMATAVGSKDNIGQNFGQIQGEKGYLYVDTATSVIDHVDLSIRGLAPERFDVKGEVQSHYYEVKAFKNIFEEKDYVACYQLLDYSLEVLAVMDQCRKSANIVFEADK